MLFEHGILRTDFDAKQRIWHFSNSRAIWLQYEEQMFQPKTMYGTKIVLILPWKHCKWTFSNMESLTNFNFKLPKLHWKQKCTFCTEATKWPNYSFAKFFELATPAILEIVCTIPLSRFDWLGMFPLVCSSPNQEWAKNGWLNQFYRSSALTC